MIWSFTYKNNANYGITFNEICLIVLLFADDMVILGLSPEDLQLSLNLLADWVLWQVGFTS